MEFSVVEFTNKLKEWFLESPSFPYYEMIESPQTTWENSRTQKDSTKHSNRHPPHLKQVAEECLRNTTTFTEDMGTFDYGNVAMESNYPHYHILQQAQVIRKKKRGTAKSKGSEEKYKIKALRDYERVSFGGKFGGKLFKEYSKNVRGARSRASGVSRWTIIDGQARYINGDSNSYLNTHYQYIDKILDEDVIWKLANYFNLKVMRKKDTGLVEDLAEQWGAEEETILDILDSFN